jgi:hypothetical protein
MATIYDFFNAWRKLIIEVFSYNPLAASLFTILAVFAFYLLQNKWNRGRTNINLLVIFVGWAILVPIVGFVMTVFGKLWTFIESVLPLLVNAIVLFYKIYERHPILIITIIILGLISYFVWKRWWANFVPRRVLRILCVILGTLLCAYIASPIADLIAPAIIPGSPLPNKQSKKSKPDSSLPKSTPPQQLPTAAKGTPPLAPKSNQSQETQESVGVPPANPTAQSEDMGK